MEVTRKNFRNTLPLVAASIDKADFLVIDAEFTGLINGRDVSIFDSPQEYYTTLLNGATEFLLIQFGLCAFYWDDIQGKYMNDAYNFYLFPRGRPGPEKIFLCQSSSLDFLAAQGFNFNKLIKDGISYMTEPTEARLRENLAERQSRTSSDIKDAITIPEENKSQIEDICKKVREFLDENKSEEMEIDRCNAFIRRLLFQELGMRFKDEAFVETKVLENKNRVLKVSRLSSANESKTRDTQKKEKEWEEFEEAVGFSKVARMISQSEKLVIGHNMLLDVLHTLNHFFQPLPSDYASFKEFAHCMFPRILDTKYMSSLPPFKDKVNSSVLQHLLATLSEPPFSLPDVDSKEGRGYTQADDKQHEAGYDAYVTGLCFLAMHAHLSRMRGDQDNIRVGAPDCALLKPFLNKLFLAKTAYQDSPYINLAGADPTPSRDHVFHLTFPKEWQRNDINQLFSAFGYHLTLQQLVEKSEKSRVRSSSLSAPAQPARKRTSSGVFQVEESEPPPKRADRTNSSSEDALTRAEVMRNGHRNTSESEKATPKNKRKDKDANSTSESEKTVPKDKRKERGTAESEKTGGNDTRKVKEITIERIDGDRKVKCVTAFKESDSWD